MVHGPKKIENHYFIVLRCKFYVLGVRNSWPRLDYVWIDPKNMLNAKHNGNEVNKKCGESLLASHQCKKHPVIVEFERN